MLPETAKGPEELPGEMEETVRLSVLRIEERLSAMLGVPVPTQGERLMENKRLHTIGEVERMKRIGRAASKKKQSLRAPVVGPSLVPKIADTYELRPEGAVVGEKGTEGQEASPSGGVPTLESLLAQIEQVKARDPSLLVTLAQSILQQNGPIENQAALGEQDVQPAGRGEPSTPARAPISNLMMVGKDEEPSFPQGLSPGPIHISSSAADVVHVDSPMDGIFNTFPFLQPAGTNRDASAHYSGL